MKIKQIIESTTTGSVAPVVMAMNGEKVQRRTEESANIRGLQPAEKVIKRKAKKTGPYENSLIEEGKVKELWADLKELSDITFKKKYNRTKEEMRKSIKEDIDLSEQDLIILPGQGRTQKTGLIKHDPDRAEHEGQTLKNSLHTIIRTAGHLDKALSSQDNFPEWVSEKIGAIKGMMVSVMDYLISRQEMQHAGEIDETGGVIAGGTVAEAIQRANGSYRHPEARWGPERNRLRDEDMPGYIFDDESQRFIRNGRPVWDSWGYQYGDPQDDEQNVERDIPIYAKWYLAWVKHLIDPNGTVEDKDFSQKMSDALKRSREGWDDVEWELFPLFRKKLHDDNKIIPWSFREEQVYSDIKRMAENLWREEKRKAEEKAERERESKKPYRGRTPSVHVEPQVNTKQQELFPEGKKIDRMVKHVEKSERNAGKSKKAAENIAWATVNKRGMLKNQKAK